MYSSFGYRIAWRRTSSAITGTLGVALTAMRASMLQPGRRFSTCRRAP